MNKEKKVPWYARLGFGLLGLALVFTGLAPLLRGAKFYETYWGGAAFAPIILIIGVAVLLLATIGWKRIARRR